MKLNPKMLAVSAALLGLLVGGAALPAGAASPFAAAPAAISLPWLAAEEASVMSISLTIMESSSSVVMV